MPRLPHAAVRLLRRSRQLTLGQKAIWQELAEFPDTGCWLSADALGDRLALSGPKVEQYRRLLKACGLARLGQRQPSEGRAGRPAQTWFATMPDHLIPASRTPTDKDLRQLGVRLDAHVVACLGRAKLEDPNTGREVSDPSGSIDSRPPRVGNLSAVAGGPSRGEGGRGEGSPHSHPVETTANPSLLPTPRPGNQRTGEAAPVAATVRPPIARTLAGTGTAEFDRTIEPEEGRTRLAPPDLAEQLDGWRRRLTGGGEDR